MSSPSNSVTSQLKNHVNSQGYRSRSGSRIRSASPPARPLDAGESGKKRSLERRPDSRNGSRDSLTSVDSVGSHGDGRKKKRSRKSSRRESSDHKKSSTSRSRSKSSTPVHARDYSQRKERRRREDNYDHGSKRKYEGRDNVPACRCLGVWGLSWNTTEEDLFQVFRHFGRIDTIRVMREQGTSRSRGFAFVYFEKTGEAVRAKEELLNSIIDGRRPRIDFSQPNEAYLETARRRGPPPSRRMDSYNR